MGNGRLFVAAALLALAAAPAPAQTYPQRPVRLVVPFAPGGGTDIIARLIAQDLTQAWGQPVVVDNRGGSGGIVGTEIAAKAAPDGYTMVLCSLGLSYLPALYSKLPFDTGRDLLPVSRVATQPFIYVALPSLGVSSIKELIALAKAKPGEIRYGSGGSGGSSHLGTELLRTMTGISLAHVPYKGTGPALTAMLAGEVHVQLIGISSVVPHMKSGRMRALAVSGAKRSISARWRSRCRPSPSPACRATLSTSGTACCSPPEPAARSPAAPTPRSTASCSRPPWRSASRPSASSPPAPRPRTSRACCARKRRNGARW